jgi:hypothetical protein
VGSSDYISETGVLKGISVMKRVIEVCVVGFILVCPVGAQDPSKPELRKGVSVQMAVAEQAVEMRAAEELDATVVAITADGRLFAGIERVEPGALNRLTAETVYVKADARVPFQRVLTVLEGLRGKSVVLLTASAGGGQVERGKIVPPYGIRLDVAK